MVKEGKIHIGCAGWDYKDWIGPFYPKKLENRQHLKFYSKYFNIVEINSTFYNLPSPEIVRKWILKTPDSFHFHIKIWQEITHKINDNDKEGKIFQFFDRIDPLKAKIKRILVQFPPWFKHSEKHLNLINVLINDLPEDYQYAIELRDNSWFYPKIVSNFIDGERFILGTTYMPGLSPFYYPAQNAHYIRLIGDRELTIFNRIQREQEEAMEDLKNKVSKLIKMANIKEIFIIANNHFAGFAPETANLIRKMFTLPIRKYNAQKKILDFI